MAMRMAALSLEEEADAHRKSNPLIHHNYSDEDDDEEDGSNDSFSEPDPDPEVETARDAPLASVAAGPSQQPSISPPRVEASSGVPVISDIRPPTPPKQSAHEHDTITISIPVPQINLPDEDDDDPAPPVHQQTLSRRPSITISATPSAGAKVQMDRAAPEPPRMAPSTSGAAVISGSAAALYGAGTSLRCAGCRDPIVGRIVSAMNQRWHPACFK